MNLAAITEHHTPDDLNNKHLFLRVLEVEKSKIKMLEDLSPGQGYGQLSFIISSRGRKRAQLSHIFL
jgi:hypothetical protein